MTKQEKKVLKEKKEHDKYFAWREKKLKKYERLKNEYSHHVEGSNNAKVKQYYQNKYNEYYTKYDHLLKQKEFDPSTRFFFKLKRWFFGVGKEFLRIDWSKKNEVFKNFIIIIIIVLFLIGVFFVLDLSLIHI